jgi:hypothetical protein
MLIGLAIALAGAAEEDPWDRLRPRVASAPRAVAHFIERRAGCNHFLGEEPYDRARAAELEKTIKELGCVRIARDERLLRQRYRLSAATLLLLDETEDLIGW